MGVTPEDLAQALLPKVSHFGCLPVPYPCQKKQSKHMGLK